MQFPVYIPFGPVLIHSHWVFETLAYLLGFQMYRLLRIRSGDILTDHQRLWIVAVSIAGAALGSKLLYWLGDPGLTLRNWNDPYYLMAGKTVVGGLLGGVFAVEWMKRRMGISRRTGDLFALPLAVGIAIGRIGCFLSGLDDDTYGIKTDLPWGVDFGDGVARHPTQIYEIVWVAMLALWLQRLSRQTHREGDIFKAFMVGYLGFRLFVEFLKPGVTIAGLTSIQWACVAMMLYYWRDLPYLLLLKKAESL